VDIERLGCIVATAVQMVAAVGILLLAAMSTSLLLLHGFLQGLSEAS